MKITVVCEHNASMDSAEGKRAYPEGLGETLCALFEGAVELEFVELRTVQAETGQDTQAVYRITGPNGEQDYAAVSLPDGAEEAARQPQPVMGYYETISLKNGKLMFCTSLSAGLSADPSFSSLGSLSASFIYDRQIGAFALTGPARLDPS